MSMNASAVIPATETPSAASTPLIVANNIVFNHLFEAVHSGKPQKCRIAKGKTIAFQIASGTTTDLTEFDLAVLSCLNSIWLDESNPENTFSITSLCRMLGCTKNGGLSPHIQKEVTASLQRLATVWIVIDPTADFELHRQDYLDRHSEVGSHDSWEQMTGIKWAAPNSLIRLGKKSTVIPRTSGDKTESCYRLLSEPLLLTYSNITGQIVTIPQERFQIFATDEDHALTKSRISMTKNRIGQVFWLARQTARIRYTFEHPKKRKRKWVQKEPEEALLLSKIFQRSGLDRRTASRHKGTLVAFLKDVLRCWEAQGLLPSWSLRSARFGPDAIVFHGGEPAPAPAPAPAEVPAIPADSAPEFHTILGAIDTIVGALDAILGACKTPVKQAKTALQSSLQALKTAAENLYKYSMYMKPLTPAPAYSGGRGVRQLK